MIKISNEELVKFLIENRTDDYGDLDLSNLDFTQYKVNVDISKMKVNGDLYQSHCETGGNLYQGSQKVQGDLIQNNQKVQGDLYQTDQKVNGDLLSHKLGKNEKWEERFNYMFRVVKKPKEITLDELREMGFVLKEGE